MQMLFVPISKKYIRYRFSISKHTFLSSSSTLLSNTPPRIFPDTLHDTPKPKHYDDCGYICSPIYYIIFLPQQATGNLPPQFQTRIGTEVVYFLFLFPKGSALILAISKKLLKSWAKRLISRQQGLMHPPQFFLNFSHWFL